ncbi:MAG: PadR family transcriptional regulator [Thermodesulfobacteriota bacterium]
MGIRFQDCPCSGKAIKRHVAPWILLTVYQKEGVYGYEINKILQSRFEDLDFSLNIAGIYRHLKSMEHRGVLRTQWDTRDPGPARRRYYLTQDGRQCLAYWLQTLRVQAKWIGRFFQDARSVFPIEAETPETRPRRS